MKKLTLWFLTMLTVLATVGCLVACGGVSLKQDSGTGETTQTGTWKVNPDDSSKIDITIGGITETASCSGGTLIINNSALGGTVTLKK